MDKITFKKHKTVLLSFGQALYRAKVIRERRINDQMTIGAIEESLRIIPDGQTCRMLGAWIGNNVFYITPWPAVLEKMARDLERWKASHRGQRPTHLAAKCVECMCSAGSDAT
ncbi:hypothetical protein DFH09DRAFT_897529 [Mycena vulgaris]|nr:hypothetical protein DFH09DRAFT_897529 [Mycena vulgaris]